MQNKHKWIIWGILSLLVLTVGGLFYSQTHFIDTLNPQTKAKNMKNGVLIIRQNGCTDCEHVEHDVAKDIFANHVKGLMTQPRVETVVVNARGHAGQYFIHKYQLERTPTFIVLKGGKVVNRYVGTDLDKIHSLLTDVHYSK